MSDFARPLAQGQPVQHDGVQYKDTSPHFERIEALSALIGTVVSQLLQAGAPYTDTLGNFRPIVIGANGITVNSSPSHLTTLAFHDTSSAGADALLGTRGPLLLVFEPNTTLSSSVVFLVADRDITAGTSAGIQINASAGLAALQGTVTAGGAMNTIWSQTQVVRVKAGAPADGDFAQPENGMAVLDTTNSRIYFRVGGTWKFAALT